MKDRTVIVRRRTREPTPTTTPMTIMGRPEVVASGCSIVIAGGNLLVVEGNIVSAGDNRMVADVNVVAV